MKKTLIVFLFLTLCLVFNGGAQAANTCQITLTSPGIYGGVCQKLGAVNFAFDAGTVFTAGDWWVMYLPNEVSICKPLDYLIVGNAAAGKVNITGGATGSLFDPGTSIATMAAGTISGPMSISPGGAPTVVAVGDVAIRLTAQESSQRVLLQVYGSVPGATITVGDGTVFCIKVLDGALHQSNILLDSNMDGVYGESGAGDSITGPVPDGKNSLCAIVGEEADDLIFTSFDSFQSFITFTSDSLIAHLIGFIDCTQVGFTGLKLDWTGYTFTAEANGVSACGQDVYYRFELIADYGTDNYNSPYNSETIQDFSKNNRITHTVVEDGNYVLVVWGSTSPNLPEDPAPMIGSSIRIGQAPCADKYCSQFYCLSIGAGADVEVGDLVEFNVRAAGTLPDPRPYYRFDLVPNYGTANYDPAYNWQTVRDFSQRNDYSHQFDEPGSYVIVVHASSTPNIPSGAAPVIGGVVTVKPKTIF